MTNYVLTYYGEAQFASQEEGQAYQIKWREWSGNIGDKWVNAGWPIARSKTVSTDDVKDNSTSPRVTGFSVLSADSLEAAIEIAKKCPHLEHGTVDVAEAYDMEM